MKSEIRVCQNPFCKNDSICIWHRNYQKNGKEFSNQEIFPDNCCPFLFHSLYPYFLAYHYGAKFTFNADGDCNACCPAHKGVDAIVCKRNNDNTYDKRIGRDRIHIIFADIIETHCDCPYGHKKGDRIIFPTSMMQFFMCPAGLNNIFPFLEIPIPECIDKTKIRCPDWTEDIYYNIEKEQEL